MKLPDQKISLFLLVLTLAVMPVPAQESTTGESPASPYLGMWALALDYENNNAGWLEVRQEAGYLDADLLWRWGYVYPVDFTLAVEGQLILVHGRDVVRSRDADGHPTRITHPVNWFQMGKDGPDRLKGMAFFANDDGIGSEAVSFTGTRIRPYGDPPSLNGIKYGEPVQLFNGRNLSGWEALDPRAANGWKVVDGALVNNPEQVEGKAHVNYTNLRTSAVYNDFRLKTGVNVPEGSNSGIYLRGIYEVQVMDSYGKSPSADGMGALFSRIAPSTSAEKPAGEWQDLDILLYKRHLTVKLNGVTIIDNQPVKGVTGGALTSDENQPGPIYLQGDHGMVSFRNMVLTPVVE